MKQLDLFIPVPKHWLTLSERGRQMAIRCGTALFKASVNIPNRMKPDNLKQRINNTGAEVALAEMLEWDPHLPPAYLLELQAWDPIRNVGTFGRVPDIAIGRGIDVRHRGSRYDDLIFRKKDHPERIWANMAGHWPRYAFAGWVIPAELGDLRGFKQTYNKPHLDPVSGLPYSVRNFLLEELIKAL